MCIRDRVVTVPLLSGKRASSCASGKQKKKTENDERRNAKKKKRKSAYKDADSIAQRMRNSRPDWKRSMEPRSRDDTINTSGLRPSDRGYSKTLDNRRVPLIRINRLWLRNKIQSTSCCWCCQANCQLDRPDYHANHTLALSMIGLIIMLTSARSC